MQDYHFFGVQAKPNKAYDVQVQDGRELHITAACVEVDSKKPSSLHMKVENNDFVVAAFGGDKLMCNIDLIVSPGQSVSFSVRGDRAVHVTGYYKRQMGTFFGGERGMMEFPECFEEDEENAAELEEIQAALAELKRGSAGDDEEDKSSKKKRKAGDENGSQKKKARKSK